MSWLWGGSGSIGEITILPEWPEAEKWKRVVVFIATSLVIVVLATHKAIDGAIEGRLVLAERGKGWLIYRLVGAVTIFLIVRTFKSDATWFLWFLLVLSPTIAIIITVALKGAVSVALGGAFTIYGASIFAVVYGLVFLIVYKIAVTSAGGFIVATAGAVAYVGAGAGTAAALGLKGELLITYQVAFVLLGVGIFMKLYNTRKYWSAYFFSITIAVLVFVWLWAVGALIKPTPAFVSYFLFIVILPFANGLLDFISLAISRWLGEKMTHDTSWKTIAKHIAYDLIAAVFLLCALVFILGFGIEAFNVYIAKTPELRVNLEGFIKDGLEDPLGPRGLWITIMLFSTLLPTLVHFLLAIYGAFTLYIIPQPLRDKVLSILKKKKPSNLEMIAPVCYYTARLVVPLTACVLLSVAMFKGLNMALPYAKGLANIAYYGISLMH